MALRDRFDKIMSYFDTEDAALEEQDDRPAPLEPAPKKHPGSAVQPAQQPAPAGSAGRVASTRPQPQPAPRPYPEQGRQEQASPRPQAARDYARSSQPVPRPQTTSAPIAQPLSAQATRPAQQHPSPQATIALRYPRHYEDAPAIVDLLVNNECVLIDFEYMDEAQARRCIDFIDGASKVLYGSIRRVSSTLYLLAPANVVVDMEHLQPQAKTSQEAGFDYDMKRR